MEGDRIRTTVMAHDVMAHDVMSYDVMEFDVIRRHSHTISHKSPTDVPNKLSHKT
jgi:hypothetical protein